MTPGASVDWRGKRLYASSNIAECQIGATVVRHGLLTQWDLEREGIHKEDARCGNPLRHPAESGARVPFTARLAGPRSPKFTEGDDHRPATMPFRVVLRQAGPDPSHPGGSRARGPAPT